VIAPYHSPQREAVSDVLNDSEGYWSGYYINPYVLGYNTSSVKEDEIPKTYHELLDPRFEVVETGRGGRYTYHGPGQRVGYLMLDLEKRGKDIRCFVHALEGWLIAALGDLGVAARREPGRIGLWVGSAQGEAKIAAIGVRVKRWVTLHGFSVNVAPDLSHFAGIVPCGIRGYGVTSLAALGVAASMADVDAALRDSFSEIFAR